MESLYNVINLIHKDEWMASVDLKDAFYSIPVNKNHKNQFLKFMVTSRNYKFIVNLNGYKDAMRVFTKILKPPFAKLRSEGHLSVVYVDDTYLQGDSFNECKMNVQATIKLLQELVFTIHPEKSILKPTQSITFLGFIIDSKNMVISLTYVKKQNIFNLASQILTKRQVTIRKLAKFIGCIVSSFPAVPYGQ